MISFIIPTLNEERTIERTLKSIKELTVYDYEIIISDGKSTDKTIELAKKYSAGVEIYQGTTRQTISNARNLGASVAVGDFLVFLDADVVVPDINNFIKKCLTSFDKQKDLLGLTVCIRVLPEFETFADKIIFTTGNHIFSFFNNVLGFGGASGEFQMIRSQAFKALGGYDETLAVAEDNDLFRRLARKGKTRIEMSLVVMHTGRRAHKVGWPKLLFSWWANWLAVLIFGRSVNKVWKEIR